MNQKEDCNILSSVKSDLTDDLLKERSNFLKNKRAKRLFRNIKTFIVAKT